MHWNGERVLVITEMKKAMKIVPVAPTKDEDRSRNFAWYLAHTNITWMKVITMKNKTTQKALIANLVVGLNCEMQLTGSTSKLKLAKDTCAIRVANGSGQDIDVTLNTDSCCRTVTN